MHYGILVWKLMLQRVFTRGGVLNIYQSLQLLLKQTLFFFTDIFTIWGYMGLLLPCANIHSFHALLLDEILIMLYQMMKNYNIQVGQYLSIFSIAIQY